MVKVALAGKERLGGQEIFAQFLMPATLFAVDETAGNNVPDLTVALLVKGAWPVLVEKGGRANAFGHRPPELVGFGRLVIPIECVEKPALCAVPAKLHRLTEKLGRRSRHPVAHLA